MLETFAKTAVEINGLLVPFKKVPDAIRRFCVPALLHAEDGPSDIALYGSAFVFRYRTRNFAICTRHQFGKGAQQRSGEDFTLTFRDRDGRLIGLNPNRITKLNFEALEHQNLADLFLAEYEDRSGIDMRSAALAVDFDKTLDGCPPDRLKLLFSIGYPLEASAYELSFDEDEMPVGAHVTARWMRVFLEADGPAFLDTENRRAMVPHHRDPTEPSDPNGFSGAPVFFLALDKGNNAYIGFAGIITDARRGRFMVYDSRVIRQILDRYIDLEEPAAEEKSLVAVPS